MSDIFICYSRTDISIAIKLLQRLQAEGWNVFIDKQTHVGRRWHKEIEKELHAAKAIVVLWSANSRDSDYVLEEAEYGKRNNILFPVFIEQVENPYGFSRIQTADLIGWESNPGHPGLVELVDSLRLHLNSHALEFESGTDANVKSEPEPIHPIAASEITSHNNLKANADASNNQAPKKRIILWSILVFLGFAIFPAAKWIYDRFSQSEMPAEELINETEMTPKIVQEVAPSKKTQMMENDLPSDELLPELILIPAGSFSMGEQDKAFIKTLDDDIKRYFGVPGISVDIKESFYLGKTEVTYEQYDYYVQAQQRSGQQIESPATKIGGRRGKHPVVNVNWFDAMAYAAWVGEQTQQSCRLPTEAEWEYAVRANTQTAYPWSDDLGVNNANCSGCGSQWDGQEAAPVGSFAANKFGLYDMSGNVWEWTCSNWRDQFDDSEQQCNNDTDGNQKRVLRGGSWLSFPDKVRSAARNYDYAPSRRYWDNGFRVLCSSPIE